MSDYTKLEVWRKAHALAIEIDRIVGEMRGGARAHLRSQMSRAALSIPANIVEGSSQRSRRQYVRYLRIALNSTSELEYHLRFSRDSGALPAPDVQFLRSSAIEIRKMLHGLITRLENLGDEE